MAGHADAGSPLPTLSQRWQARLTADWRAPRPTLLCWLLRPLSWLYGALAALARASYHLGLRRSQHAPCPVIVVGNLVAGGAGKTPAVIAIVQALRAAGLTPGVVSRGYGRRHAGVVLADAHSSAADIGDEPLLIHRRCAVPVAVGRQRAAAALALCAAHPEIDVLVADDGLQHQALARDVEVLVFDDRGIGNGLLLPAGPLRQRPPRQLPAQALVLYSAGVPSTALPGYLGQRRLGGVLRLHDWWHGNTPTADSWAALRGRPVVAAAGLARPEAFLAMLHDQGLDCTPLPLPDHHDFAVAPWPAGTAAVVVTEKDAVKLPPDAPGSTEVWVATLDFAPEPAFFTALLHRLPTRESR